LEFNSAQEVRPAAKIKNKNALRTARPPLRTRKKPKGRRRARAKAPAAVLQPPACLRIGSSRATLVTEIVAVLVVDVSPAAILTEDGTVQEIAMAFVEAAQLRVKLLAVEEGASSAKMRVETAERLVAPLAKVTGVALRVKSSEATVTLIETVEGRSCASPL